MIPVYQTRTGARGNCFAASLASILETSLPEFGEDDEYWHRVNTWLATKGLAYKRVSLASKPVGWSTIEGVSPRGGLHACVAFNGELKFDPHPPSKQDGQGLVKPKYYGVLIKSKHSIQDAAPLSGKRLNVKAELLRTRHDEIVSNHLRGAGSSAETAYNALYRPTANLVHDAEVLLTKTNLDDDPAYWHRKLDSARDHLDEAARLAKAGKWSTATSYLDAALTMAHMVIDKMRKSGSSRGRDVLPASRILKYDIADMLDRVGVTPTEFLRRDSEQRRGLLETAFQELSKEKGGSVVARAKDTGVYQWRCPKCRQVFGGETVEALENRGWHHLEIKHQDESTEVKPQRVSATDSRRTRLHRALDAVMDGDPGMAPVLRAEVFQIRRAIQSLEIDKANGERGADLRLVDAKRLLKRTLKKLDEAVK